MTNEVKTYKYWRYNPDNDWLYCMTDNQVYNMQLFYYISTQSSQDRIYFNCPPTNSEIIDINLTINIYS
jgi:hypothetical protein